MDNKVFEQRMRRLEVYHGLRVPDGAWTILRLDGRNFSKLTESQFQKPFDKEFSDLMVLVTTELVEKLGAIYGYTESDEISVLLPRDSKLFDREVEKLVSLSASLASSAMTLEIGDYVQFDARVVVVNNFDQLFDYFRWRQEDANRNSLHSTVYWTLRKIGHSGTTATGVLDGKDHDAKNELLKSLGIDYTKLPAWQSRGIGVRYEPYYKEATNFKTGEATLAHRRRLQPDVNLPKGDDYATYLDSLLFNQDEDDWTQAISDPINNELIDSDIFGT